MGDDQLFDEDLILENIVTMTVTADQGAGSRLDQFLQRQLPEHSRSFFKKLIDEGRVTIDAGPAKPSQTLRAGQAVLIDFPEPEPIEPKPEPIPLSVIHEDKDIIVLDKPAGMVVHPAAGHGSGTLVNALLHHCTDLSGIGGKLRPGIVHRLDKGTSGVMVAAKNDQAHRSLAGQFKARSIGKQYLAICWSCPAEKTGRIDLPIGRHVIDRQRMAVNTSEAGRAALTEYRLLERFSQASYLSLEIHTGRTHQIRVHLASIGCPVLGDDLYGGARKASHLKDAATAEAVVRAARPLLHAHRIALAHPRTGERMEFTAPLPRDMDEVLALLRKTR